MDAQEQETVSDNALQYKISTLKFILKPFVADDGELYFDGYAVSKFTNKVVCYCDSRNTAEEAYGILFKEATRLCPITDCDWKLLPTPEEKNKFYHHIEISATFCTDGDYSVEDCDDLIIKEEDGTYTFKYTVTNQDLGLACCAAESTIWRLICDCIHVGHTHPWLLKDFYEGGEELEGRIHELRSNMAYSLNNFEWTLGGNYDGTCISVKYKFCEAV